VGAITTKGRKLHQIEHVPYEKAFLIGDLLTSNITMLAGEPKAGKTNFAAGMSAAHLNGADEFLGLPVLRPCRHIVFGLTDDGAEGELRERLHGAVPRDSVTVFPVEDTSQPGYWQGVHDDLVSMVDTLRERDIGFKVLTGALANIDPGTADGRLMLQVVGAMAEFERSLIKERTRAGLDAARAQGRTGGRPAVMNDDMLTVARARRAKGESVNALARALGVSRATLYRHIGEGA
jgi:hypothetical protein